MVARAHSDWELVVVAQELLYRLADMSLIRWLACLIRFDAASGLLAEAFWVSFSGDFDEASGLLAEYLVDAFFQYGVVVRIARTLDSYHGLDSHAVFIKIQACWQNLYGLDSRPGSLCFLQEQPWENIP